MFTIGAQIRDNAGNLWLITSVWTYKYYLCVSLIGAPGPVEGQMGGARFKQGDPIYVKR